MKKLLLIIIPFVLFGFRQTAEGDSDQSYTISGTIHGDYSGYIYLFESREKKDSAKVVNHRFEFKGSVERPRQGWMHLKPRASIAWVYIENSRIEIEADFYIAVDDGKSVNVLEIKKVTGSYSARIQEEYWEFVRANKTKEDYSGLLYAKLQTYLKENKSHPFSGKLLSDLALRNPILTEVQLNSLYSLIDTTQQDKWDLDMIRKGLTGYGKYGVGSPFIKFMLPDVSQKQVDIASYLGKITLVDFWASWCGPCREKHPDLIKLKDEFANTDFDILSISLDKEKDKEKWLRAIEKDQLSWTNLLDMNMDVANQLKIVAIPYSYLLDKKGNILGINPSVEQVRKIVGEQLKR